MDSATRQYVVDRAQARCEYCRLPQAGHDERFSIDHVIARKHGGDDSPKNLALSCLRCNLHKGTDLATVDPLGGGMVSLFNPRQDNWSDHFRRDGCNITGITPVGRATTRLLQMNSAERVQLREVLVAEGLI